MERANSLGSGNASSEPGRKTLISQDLVHASDTAQYTRSSWLEAMQGDMETVNLREKLSRFNDYWSPKIVGEVNDSSVKLVKFRGEFLWHHHEQEDELFLVIKGTLRMKVRDPDERELVVREGEFLIVPHGT